MFIENESERLMQFLNGNLTDKKSDALAQMLNDHLAEYRKIFEDLIHLKISARDFSRLMEDRIFTHTMARAYLVSLPIVGKFFDIFWQQVDLYNPNEEMRKQEPYLIGEKELQAYVLSAFSLFPQLPIQGKKSQASEKCIGNV